jgi:hypothetical protein
MTIPMGRQASSNIARTLTAVAVLILVLAALVWQAPQISERLSILGLGDYIAYWSAGRVLAEGGNPYSPKELLAVQSAEGWKDDWPNIMYYPPWALALVLPFGLLPFWVSRLVWLLAGLGIIIWCADRAWIYFSGPEQKRMVAWLIAMSFVPTLMVLRIGQIAPWLLLGTIGFLEAERRRADWVAGVALTLTTVKPHLMFLFGLAALVWCIAERRWRILGGSILTVGLATALAAWRDPNVLVHYQQFAVSHPPFGNVTPTIGGMLRVVFGERRIWLQFVPTAIALLWFPFYWHGQRRNWHWEEQAALLILISFVATAYGAWAFDLVVLLIPLIQAAVRLLRNSTVTVMAVAVTAYVLIDGTALLLNVAAAKYPAFIWITPAVWLFYWVAMRPRSDVAVT